MGQVSQINDHDIALALPNNLTGYVPITSISDELTRRLEAIAAGDAKDSGEDIEDESEDDEEINFGKLFRLGQYVRAYVVSTSDEATSSTSKAKRRIELSLRPQQSNNELSVQNMVSNTTLMASVVSVEDHGLIMNLGPEDINIRGFMSSNEIGYNIKLSDVQEGAVLLCVVTGRSSNGKIIKLSSDLEKFANQKKFAYLADALTIDAFLPGTAVEILVSETAPKGIVGKVMGMVDVTADLIHSGASTVDIEKNYKLGSKVKGRIVCNFPTSDPPKLGVSLLGHVISLTQRQTANEGKKQDPMRVLPLSAIVEEVKVSKVQPGIGLFVDVGVKGVPGFVHISMVKDGKVDELFESSGPYKLGSTHRGRVVGYNGLDGVYLVSLEQSVLEQPFLRIEDVPVGQIVKGTVEKLIVNAEGVGGILVNLAAGITGLVPGAHLADVQLQHPEKKFKEGLKVTARVMSTNPNERRIRLTLKKSLVNSEAEPFITYESIHVGMQSPGTVVNLLPTGAVIQFYGKIRGWLPVSQMSEAYIPDPKQHFRMGQVVNVHVLSVDAEKEQLLVSCKDPSVFGSSQQAALKSLKIGETVSATITEINSDSISVELQESSLRATLAVGHLSDGSEAKNRSALKKLRVGKSLTDLLVVEILEEKNLVVLSNKPTLQKDAKTKNLLRSFLDVKEGKIVHGFVKNITSTAVFVQFPAGLVGLLPKDKLLEEALSLPEFGMRKHQTVKTRIIAVDHSQQRFLLSMRPPGGKAPQESSSTVVSAKASNPVDDKLTSVDDLHLGQLTKAKILSVKDTQINVQLADNIQGRIDVSQIFDTWDQIKDRKWPLRNYSAKQVVDVRILGIHDARSHRFLPITHRAGKNLVFELSAKPSDQNDKAEAPLTMDKIKVGSTWIAFVNNIGGDCLWVNLSPNVRGRIRAIEVSDDVSLLKDLESNFPIGSAIRVHVTAVDAMNNRLDLSARSSQTDSVSTLDKLVKDIVLPGKITKVSERQIIVQLSENVTGAVHLVDLADDFSEAIPTKYSKNDIVRVCILDIDKPNKKIRLSTRPSRVLNSSLPVEDPEISSISQLKRGDVVRGFIKNVTDKGLFVNLGGDVTAYIRVSHLSDSYIKDWKAEYHVDQLVKGKVIELDSSKGNLQLSLKASVLDKNFKPLLTFNDYKVGQIVTGKVRKVADFGVFVVLDGSANVSGLCYQVQVAEKHGRGAIDQLYDVKKLYEEGDPVKAKILRLNKEKRRITLGLKASYFEDPAESEDDDDDSMHGVRLDNETDESEDDSEGGVNLKDVESIGDAAEKGSDAGSDEEMMEASLIPDVPTLKAGGFDWNANIFNRISDESVNSDDDIGDEEPKKKRKRKAEIKIDRTGELDANGPQSVSDFERLLLGQPDSSQLWTAYMAFLINLSEVDKAREIAERAIKTINIREDTEKMNMWIALLNLEISYGSNGMVEEVFKRACQYNDAQEIHERLASSYIHAGKHDVSLCLLSTIRQKLTCSTESRRPLPSHDEEVLSIPHSLVQLRSLPAYYIPLPRSCPRSTLTCYTISSFPCPPSTYPKVCSARIPLSIWLPRAWTHHVRRYPRYLPQETRYLEPTTGLRDPAGR